MIERVEDSVEHCGRKHYRFDISLGILSKTESPVVKHCCSVAAVCCCSSLNCGSGTADCSCCSAVGEKSQRLQLLESC